MTTNPLDPVLDFEYVLSLTHRHLPSAKAVEAVDESGGEARAYVIDQVYIFKTQRPHKVRLRTSLEKETFHLNLIAREAPDLSVPRVLGYGREVSVEYVFMTRIPGVAARNLTLAKDARAAVLRELGRTLRGFHELPLAQFEASGLFPADRDSADVRTRLQAYFNRALEAITVQRDAWRWAVSPESLAKIALDAVAVKVDLAALHSNPGPEHVFVDPDSLGFSGVIDFGDAFISHPAFDMARWTTPADRSAVLAGYAENETLSEAFMATWRAVMIAGIMSVFALRPQRQAEALDDLKSLVKES